MDKIKPESVDFFDDEETDFSEEEESSRIEGETSRKAEGKHEKSSDEKRRQLIRGEGERKVEAGTAETARIVESRQREVSREEALKVASEIEASRKVESEFFKRHADLADVPEVVSLAMYSLESDPEWPKLAAKSPEQRGDYLAEKARKLVESLHTRLAISLGRAKRRSVSGTPGTAGTGAPLTSGATPSASGTLTEDDAYAKLVDIAERRKLS